MKKKRFGSGGGIVARLIEPARHWRRRNPRSMVKQRQAVMTLQGKYFGPMAGMAQGKIPYNADVVQRNCRRSSTT